MIDFIIFLTYVAEVAGALGIVGALVLLVLSGPESDPRRTTTTDDAGTTTYWYGAEPISRAEYDHLSRRGLPADHPPEEGHRWPAHPVDPAHLIVAWCDWPRP